MKIMHKKQVSFDRAVSVQVINDSDDHLESRKQNWNMIMERLPFNVEQYRKELDSELIEETKLEERPFMRQPPPTRNRKRIRNQLLLIVALCFLMVLFLSLITLIIQCATD